MIEFNPIPLNKSINKAGLKFRSVIDELERFKKEFKKFLSLANKEENVKMVYKLYGLTVEEINIIEKSFNK